MEILEKIRQDPHSVSSWFLPRRLGRVSLFLLKFLFSGIKFDPDQAAVIRRLPGDAILIFTTKHKSHLERLFFFVQDRHKEIPCPEIGIGYSLPWLQPLSRLFRVLTVQITHWFRTFRLPDPIGSGYVGQQLQDGRTAFISIVDTGSFHFSRRSGTDPLQSLLEMQNISARPICLVPCLFFYGTHHPTAAPGTGHRSSGVDPKPGILYRLFYMLFAPEKVFVEISEPVNLQQFTRQPRHARRNTRALTLTLRHQLLDQITRHRQSITGPILKPIEEIRQHILTTERLRTFMGRWASRRRLSMFQVQQEAVKYVDEIAAKPSPLVVQMGAGATRWLINTLFEGLSVNVEGINKMKQASRKGPLIIMPCHKSNMDSLVVSYVMTRHDMPCPHVFAGKNLAFWPMGPVFRRLGAFFVRRSFKGAVFYAKVFSEYIHMLLDQGFNISVFVEGGRSRSGKLLLPKLGMLAVLLNAVKNGACEHLNFIPVFIGYDRVPELGSYINEMEGGEKKPESFGEMLRARKLLKKRFGSIHLKFCDPVSLNDLAGRYGRSVRELTPKLLNALCRDVGRRVLAAVDDATVVTQHALVSASILNNPGHVISRRQIGELFGTYLAHLTAQRAELSESILRNPDQSVESVIEYYVKVKYLQPVRKNDAGSKSSRKFRLNPAKRPAMDYYKNSCIAPFVPAAFTAMAILLNDSFLFSPQDLCDHYRLLEKLFENEFNRTPDQLPEHQVQTTLDSFRGNAIVVANSDLRGSYQLTARGYRKIKRFARFLKPLLESYWIVLVATRESGTNGRFAANRLKRVQATGTRMYRRDEIEGKEALSGVSFSNALDLYRRSRLKRSAASATVEQFETILLDCLKRLA